MSKSKGGVYVYRARKPAARLNLPFFSRHFAYVGETTSFAHRHAQHVGKPGPPSKYNHAAKPWSDLDPKVVLRIPLPRWKWLLKFVETIFIGLTWPVYNHKKNLWNPRRIPLGMQLRQRYTRDRGGFRLNFTGAHLFFLLVFVFLALRLSGVL